MKRILFVCCLLFASAAFGQSTFEQACVDEINRVRAERGLPVLTVLDDMQGDARRSAELQRRNGRVGHFVGLQCPAGFAGCGEICASGDDAKIAVRLWMNSSGHRNIMLSASKTHISVGHSGRFWAARLVGPACSGGSCSTTTTYSKTVYRNGLLFR